jgi:hypothetical protein
MTRFKCPHCQKDVSVADEHAGKKGRCPGCKGLFVIPAAAPARPAPSVSRNTAPPRQEEEVPRQSRPAVKRPADEEDYEVIEDTPRKTRPSRRYEEDDEAIAEAPRKTRPAKPARDDYDDEEDEGPRRKRGGRARDEDDYDDDYEEDERPRRKKGRRGPYADCPNCGARGHATKLNYTFWGGLIGPLFISHVRCKRCGTCYNGTHGDYNTGRIAIFMGVTWGIGILLGILLLLLRVLL